MWPFSCSLCTAGALHLNSSLVEPITSLASQSQEWTKISIPRLSRDIYIQNHTAAPADIPPELKSLNLSEVLPRYNRFVFSFVTCLFCLMVSKLQGEEMLKEQFSFLLETQA